MKVEKLSFAYGEHKVLSEVSFEAEYGQFISVLGPNGVGKSTLFRCMLGLLEPTDGGAYIDGKSVSGMSAAALARHIAYIPQSHNPVFNFTVFDMVLMGTTSQTGSFSSPGKQQVKLARKALKRLGIWELRDRGYGNISGGERQLVLIARAIAQQAKVLIMDEPSANLDFGNRIRVMNTVRELTADGFCIIQSTHDPEQAYLYSDRILALHEGRVLAWDEPKGCFSEELISTLYGVDVEVHSLHDDSVRVCVPKHEESKIIKK